MIDWQCSRCGMRRAISPEHFPVTCCGLRTGLDGQQSQPAKERHPRKVMTDAEQRELFGESDPTLFGERIAALTKAIGIPPCGGCNQRRAWLNRAHAWLRGG